MPATRNSKTTHHTTITDVLVVPSDTPPTSADDTVCEINQGLAALKNKIPKNNEVYQNKYGPRLKRENVEMQTPWPKNAVAMPTCDKVQEYMGYVENVNLLFSSCLLRPIKRP